MVEQPGPSEIQKEGLTWIFMSHQSLTAEDVEDMKDKIKKKLDSTGENAQSTIFIKFEGIDLSLNP